MPSRCTTPWHSGGSSADGILVIASQLAARSARAARRAAARAKAFSRGAGITWSSLLLAACAGGSATGPVAPPQDTSEWSAPVSLVSAHGRVALGNRVHVVGHVGGNLVHRSSRDDGATWSAPTVIAAASGNYPMQYGGLFAIGDTVYLLTAAGDMGSTSQHLDFRKSVNNGATWSSPVRVTGSGQQLRRANIAANGATVHVFGGQSGAGGYGTSVFYFRSTDGGATWGAGVSLFDGADASARLAVDGTTVHVSFGVKPSASSFGGRTTYRRSIDDGATWGPAVPVGESAAEARQMIAAADGRVIIMWQREAPAPGGPLPADRLGYATSNDGGATWSTPKLLPDDSGVDRQHHQVSMSPGGGVHVVWSHGNPTDPASPAGYKRSLDYGSTWSSTELALNTPGSANVPHGIVANSDWVHLIAQPGAGLYARRPLR